MFMHKSRETNKDYQKQTWDAHLQRISKDSEAKEKQNK